MQTLTMDYGRSPLSIKPGQTLRSNSHTKLARQRVQSVHVQPSTGTITVVTDEDRYSFEPGQLAVFPRRMGKDENGEPQAGRTVVHRDPTPHITQVFVGDVVAPPQGWAEGEPDLESGRLVTDIQISAKLEGWVISYRPTDGSAGGKMFVSRYTPNFYNGAWTDDVSTLAKTGRSATRSPRPNTTGIYTNLITEESVRFRIPNRRGPNPKHGQPVKASPTEDTIAFWEPWVFKAGSGERHPNDPRK